jgi:hypothetical protein
VECAASIFRVNEERRDPDVGKIIWADEYETMSNNLPDYKV